MTDPAFVHSLKESLGQSLFSARLGERAERSFRTFVAKTFDLNPELVGVHDEDDRVTVEIGPVFVSFMKITRIDVDCPELEEEKLCIGCGEYFKILLGNKSVFCDKCAE